MSQYRELVNRQLNVRHAGMEMGLAKAREQEAFVLQLDRLLSQTSWPHEMGMSRDFDVVFNVFQLTAARRRLAPPLKPLPNKACIALFR